MGTNSHRSKSKIGKRLKKKKKIFCLPELSSLPRGNHWYHLGGVNSIYFWLSWVFTVARGLSPVVVSRVCSVLYPGLRASLTKHGLCGLRELSLTGLVARRHVGSAATRISAVSPALPAGCLTPGPPH